MSNEVLILKEVSVTYRGKAYSKDALRNLSLSVNRGEVFGFLGPNGAGKTTTIKSILNLLYPTQGSIFVFDSPSFHPRVRQRIGYMPEIAQYYWYLTPRELMMMYAGFFGIKKNDALRKIDGLCALVGLEKEAGVLMKNFSKGMMQKVSLAQALINDPELLILDEPTSGLDPVARMKVRDIIKDLKAKGTTVFFSSHELSEVELISDRIGILNAGRMVTVADMKDILSQKGHRQSLERYFLDIITKEENQ
ncbi:MAG: ABC transporter ATP-binding protein [Candidatus Omnitrophica bacterium]|nr:ABC transporter ATP-binding protein [Candidatus Omnitrophota bacterium]MBU4478428.1 ABC transporter ATP-binding protein [Candidatus Omnitrophota bacterium]